MGKIEQLETSQAVQQPAEQLEAAPDTLDMSPTARLQRTQEIQGRLASREAVDVSSLNPKSHCPEIIALAHQARKHGIGVEL
jgi:hypothetical protein